jgi:hypothetical protein
VWQNGTLAATGKQVQGGTEMADPLLSKSNYLLGLKCTKLLWVHCNAKTELPPVDERTQAIFDQGHEAGLLARGLFPGGIAVDGGSTSEVLARTRSLLEARKPLFEPGFTFSGGYARLDVLNPQSGGEWEIVEVKSGTSVTDPHWDDVAFQRFCCEGSGIQVARCRVVHINNGYVRHGEVDPDGLFVSEDVTDGVDKKRHGIADRIDDMHQVVSLNQCPLVDIGPHCSAWNPCALRDTCWEHVDKVEDNTFTLHRGGARIWPLFRKGVMRNSQIPTDFKLSKVQRIQVDAEKTGQPHVNTTAVRKFLGTLRYPLHFLDFETFQTAIPLIEGTKPYQKIPFQFSLHIVPSPGSDPRHFSWLWDGSGEPRKELLDQLSTNVGKNGSVIAYNASFEKGCLEESVEAYPGYSDWLESVLKRLVDLWDPFKLFTVYYPSQHGSTSLKAVLPALAGKDYHGLAIQNGSQASEEFKKVTFCEVDEGEREKVRKHLEEYCGLDTMAMVDIVRVLGDMTDRGQAQL